jgi:hypothetical protein
MPNYRARRSQVIWGLIWVAAAVLAVVTVWALLVPGTDWLARHDISAAKGSLATARDAARGRLLTLGAGLLAAGALVFTARNFILSREGQVADRYTKAIEQLGSDKLDVRIGGIYALERIARDSKKDHPTVMGVLTAFIREHSKSRGQWMAKVRSRGKRRPDLTFRQLSQSSGTEMQSATSCFSTSLAPTSPARTLLARTSTVRTSPARTSPARSSPPNSSISRRPTRT